MRSSTIYRDDTYRYRIIAVETDDDIHDCPFPDDCDIITVWTWAIERLRIDYPGCDGHCTYGCGVDPWEFVDGNEYHDPHDDDYTADTFGQAEADATAKLRQLIPNVRPE